MKLEIGNLYIKDVQFGDHDAFENGVLTIDKAAAISYLKECDDHITDLDIVIAHPGDDTRIVPVIETVEPRVRMDGRTLFPGVTDEVVPAGDGVLKARVPSTPTGPSSSTSAWSARPTRTSSVTSSRSATALCVTPVTASLSTWARSPRTLLSKTPRPTTSIPF